MIVIRLAVCHRIACLRSCLRWQHFSKCFILTRIDTAMSCCFFHSPSRRRRKRSCIFDVTIKKLQGGVLPSLPYKLKLYPWIYLCRSFYIIIYFWFVWFGLSLIFAYWVFGIILFPWTPLWCSDSVNSDTYFKV